MSWLRRERPGAQAAIRSASRLARQLDPELDDILTDATHLAHLLNDAGAGRRLKVSSYNIHKSLILLGYRLARNRPLSESSLFCRPNDAIHLGLTMFLMTFLRGLDLKLAQVPLLPDLLRSVARRDGGNPEVLLWILFMGVAASVFSPLDEAWLIPKTTVTLQGLGLHAWEAVARSLAGFPWVNALHDKLGRDYLERCMSSAPPERVFELFDR